MRSTASRKRILNVVTQMAPEGAQNAAVEVSRKLREMGYDAEVWFLYTKQPAFENVPYVRTFSPHRPSGPVEILSLLWRVFRALRKAKPAGIITYTYYANVLVQPLAFLAGVRHRLATQRNTRDLTPRIADFLDILWGTLGVYTANVFVSHAVQEGYRSVPHPYLRRSVVVYNGTEFAPSDLGKEEARKQLGLPQDAWIVGHVGRMDKNKNQQALIRALARLDIPNAVLALAGKGPEEEALRTLTHTLGLDSRVYFLGTFPRDLLAPFYAALDVFVLPSLDEGFSFVLVEAMRSGCPIAASDLPVFHEVAGNTIRYFSPQDIDEIVSILSWFHRHPEEAKTLGLQAQQRSRVFSLETMVRQYLTALFGEES